MKKKESIRVKVIFEPVNRRDENVITAQAKFDTCQPIGYIPGIKDQIWKAFIKDIKASSVNFF